MDTQRPVTCSSRSSQRTASDSLEQGTASLDPTLASSLFESPGIVFASVNPFNEASGVAIDEINRVQHIIGLKEFFLNLMDSVWHMKFSDEDHAALVPDHTVSFMIVHIVVRC